MSTFDVPRWCIFVVRSRIFDVSVAFIDGYASFRPLRTMGTVLTMTMTMNLFFQFVQVVYINTIYEYINQ